MQAIRPAPHLVPMTVSDLSSLTGITYLQDASVQYGIDFTPEELADRDKWQKKAHPWTFTLTTCNGTEEFWYFTGESITDDPTVPELIASLVIDAHYLTEDDEITYKLGKKIEANTEKCKRLFGSYWDTLMSMDEDEIAEVF